MGSEVHAVWGFYREDGGSGFLGNLGRVQMKCDGTPRLTGGVAEGKLANAVGSQYSSH